MQLQPVIFFVWSQRPPVRRVPGEVWRPLAETFHFNVDPYPTTEETERRLNNKIKRALDIWFQNLSDDGRLPDHHQGYGSEYLPRTGS